MIEKMPDDYKGKVNKGGGYTKSAPRVWTEKELTWVKSLAAKGHTVAEIAESIDRAQTAVSIKLKRLSKENNTYNKAHVQEKYAINEWFLAQVAPESVLDVFCGKASFYDDSASVVITNDRDEDIQADYHMDALEFMCKLYSEGGMFDLIDLDPYGSAYDCFDLAVKMADKGLVVTFGELGHKRWKRLDFVERYYGIETLEDFTLDVLIKHVQMIGRRNKKELRVYEAREWQNIGRVWFTIEPLKITEQWEKEAI